MNDPRARLAALFGLRGAQDWARHANPWSVWTRAAILPLMAAAIWSRFWIGPWALVPVFALIFWAFLNPRAFPPVAPNRGFCWRAVMGERLWIGPGRAALPAAEVRRILAAERMAIPPALLCAWGLWAGHAGAAAIGAALTAAAKFGFLALMARLPEGGGDDAVARETGAKADADR